MPRIPTRTTPYDTPTRQHRHFKNKRDQVLRALGRSSYINGSQFAILWVSARGETETYASPVLQGLLEPEPGQLGLFPPQILQRAIEAALKAPPELKVSEICLEYITKPQKSTDDIQAATPSDSGSRSALSGKGTTASSSPNPRGRASGNSEREAFKAGRSLLDDDDEPLPESPTSDCRIGETSSSLYNVDSRLSSHGYDPSEIIPSSHHELQQTENITHTPNSPTSLMAKEENATASSRNHSSGLPEIFDINVKVTSPLPFETNAREGNLGDTVAENNNFPVAMLQKLPDTSINHEALADEAVCVNSKDHDIDQDIRSAGHLNAKDTPPSDDPTVISFSSALSLASFLEEKFCQLQQSTCKLVCKAWIKVVEPKKQRNFPYRSGEASKPDWWPRGVVHREPDHLLKPERIRLMLALLGAGKVLVGRLELASAEMAAFIPPDKMKILRDIYTVAKEEERLRSTWPVGVNFVPFSVQLSKNTCEVPAKSLGSPASRNIEQLAASPKLISEVSNQTEPVLEFKSTLPFQDHGHQTWLPRSLPEYLKKPEPPNLSHGKSCNFPSGQFNSYVDGIMTGSQKNWSMNPEYFPETLETSVIPANRLDRPNASALENMQLQNSKNLNLYDFPLSFQTNFSDELLPSSLEIEQSQHSSTNPQLQGPSLFPDLPQMENPNWRNCDFFFANNLPGYCPQGSWKNVTVPSASFDGNHVVPEGSL